MDKESIIKKLKKHEKAVGDSLLFIRNQYLEGNDFGVHIQIEFLLDLVKYKIHPYITDIEILFEEFHKRINNYELKNNKEIKKLIGELCKDIKNLYSLINKKEILKFEKTFYEKNNDFNFYDNCIKAIKSLKNEFIETDIIDKSCYIQLFELIQNKNNYHKLNFSPYATCKELHEETKKDNFINNDNTIRQFIALELPINNNLVDNYPALVTNITQFKEKKQNYLSKINKLNELFVENLYFKRNVDFCKFEKFVNCDKSKILEADNIFKCYANDCFDSVKTVLSELIEFVEDSVNLSEEKEKCVKKKTNKQNKEIYLSFSEEKKKFLLGECEINLPVKQMEKLAIIIIKEKYRYASSNKWAPVICRINKEADRIIGQSIIDNNENEKYYHLKENIILNPTIKSLLQSMATSK